MDVALSFKKNLGSITYRLVKSLQLAQRYFNVIRIINDLDMKKKRLVKFQCDFVLDTVTVRVNEGLKGGSLPGSLKCENIRPIYKKVDPSIKRNIDQ